MDSRKDDIVYPLYHLSVCLIWNVAILQIVFSSHHDAETERSPLT